MSSKVEWEITRDISAEMGFDERVSRKFLQGLTRGGLEMGLGLIVQGITNKKEAMRMPALYAVLRHILLRTLPFYKAVEFITVRDIVEGKPTLFIAPACFQERTVAESLKVLTTNINLLVRITLPPLQSVTPIYGLNMAKLFPVLHGFSDATLIKEIERRYQDSDKEPRDILKSKYAKQGWDSLVMGMELAEAFTPVYDFLAPEDKEERARKVRTPVQDLRQLCKDLAALRPTWRDVESVVFE